MDIIIKKIIVILLLSFSISLLGYSGVRIFYPDLDRADYIDKKIEINSDNEVVNTETGELIPMSEEEKKTFMAERANNETRYSEQRDLHNKGRAIIALGISIVFIALSLVFFKANSTIISGLLLGSLFNLITNGISRYTLSPVIITIAAIIILVLTLQFARLLAKKKETPPAK